MFISITLQSSTPNQTTVKPNRKLKSLAKYNQCTVVPDVSDAAIGLYTNQNPLESNIDRFSSRQIQKSDHFAWNIPAAAFFLIYLYLDIYICIYIYIYI